MMTLPDEACRASGSSAAVGWSACQARDDPERRDRATPIARLLQRLRVSTV